MANIDLKAATPATSISTSGFLFGAESQSDANPKVYTVAAIQELIRDTIGAALVQGSNITITVNDAGDTITLAGPAVPTNADIDERARDAVGTALTAGTNMSVSVNDAGDTITISGKSDSDIAELARDTLGTALVAGTGITITPNDGADTITITATGGGGLTAYELSRGGSLIATPSRGEATVTTLGGLFQIGSSAARSPSPSNSYLKQARVANFSAASAGSNCYHRARNGASTTRRDIGFTIDTVYGIADAAAVANARMFLGLSGTFLGGVNADPSTFTNIIGFGCDAGETTFSWFENDGSGTATKTAFGTGSLGGSAPADTRETDFYRFQIVNAAGGTPVLTVTRVNTGDVWTRSPATDLPSATTGLCFYAWRNNGSTALAVGLDLFGYLEQNPWL